MAGTTMQAVQLFAPGPPSNLQIVELPIPVPEVGQVLIRVKAFGLNRSEILTRQFGRAPIGPVQLPRILGVEATGIIEEAPGSEDEFPKGAIAMTAVGGMGLFFDGGYAQFTCVSKGNVQVLKRPTALGWDILGALPEMLQTAHGALYRSLKLKHDDVLLVRGGTTSIGLTAIAIARNAGASVVATTRRSDPETAQMLKQQGAEHVIVDDGTSIAAAVNELYPAGVNKVLELVGGSTLADSISCLAKDGMCCMLGLVGGKVSVSDFNALAMIPTERYLTAYGERTFQASNFPLDDLLQQVEVGSLKIRIGAVFPMDRIVEAHECMESNTAQGKIVVLTGM